MAFKELTNGDDVYTGTTGDDDVYAYAGNDIVHGAGGNDDIYGYEGNDTLYGDDGNDELEGGADNDTLYGGSGDDSLAGGFFMPSSSIIYQDKNYLCGGAGDDRYLVSSLNDIIDESVAGSNGFDTVSTYISFSLASPSVKGTIEVLQLYGDKNLNGTGNAVNNRIYGNSGNNVLDGGAGDDQINGDAGNDVLYGGEGDDVLVGDTPASNGPSGDDKVYGDGGNDRLIGTGGNDYLDGGTGIDKMDGGVGNDSYVVDNIGDNVVEGKIPGVDKVYSSTSYTLTGQYIENLTLTGASAINGTGNSLSNVVAGNAGRNTLYGLQGNDTLNGLAGQDVIYGGIGNDTLIGGTGPDRFVFDTAPNATTNRDTITDFNVVDDNIWLDNAVYTALGANGLLSAAAFHIGAVAHDANDRIIYNSATGALFYDLNGSVAGGAVQFATLSKGLVMTNADFLII